MQSLNTYLKISLTILICGLTGFIIYPFFAKVSLYQLQDVRIQILEINTVNHLRWIFTVVITFIPLLFLTVKKFLQIHQLKQYFFIIASILISGIIFWQYKIVSIQKRFEELNQIKTDYPVQYYFARENLSLEIYLFFGFVIGALIGSIALYRFNKRNK
jgi:hypothetical protein